MKCCICEIGIDEASLWKMMNWVTEKLEGKPFCREHFPLKTRDVPKEERSKTWFNEV